MLTGKDNIRRWDVINYLIKQNNYQSYLEIGSTGRLDNPDHNFRHIDLPRERKISVDPKGDPDFKMTSDEFFARIPNTMKFDIIFIDGEHIADTVYRDITNSLMCLSWRSSIVVHDCNPPTVAHSTLQEEDAIHKVGKDGVGYYVWTGTVYKGFIKVKLDYRYAVTCRCVDVDWGCGIIRSGSTNAYIGEMSNLKPPTTFDEFAAHRKEYLGLITWTEFQEMYRGAS